MKKLILLIIISMQVTVFSAQASMNKKNSPASKASQMSSWVSIRADLIRLTQQFQNRNLSEDQKVSLLPITNELLSYMQDIQLGTSEKMDQIQIVVQLLAASLEYDFASSNADTVYFEYAKYKGAYIQAIKQLPNTRVAKELLSTFNELSSAANNFQSEAGEVF